MSLSDLNPVHGSSSLTVKLLYGQRKTSQEKKMIFPDEKSVSHFSQDSHSQQLLETSSAVKE